MTETGINWGDIDKIIDRVRDEQIEMELEITPECQRVTVRPYKPFTYACPYSAGGKDA